MTDSLRSLRLGSIKPRGWLRRELDRQVGGLSGNMEQVWEDVGPASGWLGGDGEDWERGPYYLDGLIPLAAALPESIPVQRVAKWIDWTVDSQRPDGFFGPVSNDDLWPRLVMAKALAQYADWQADERVRATLHRFLFFVGRELEHRPFDQWARLRGAEGALVALLEDQQRSDPGLRTSARRMLAATFDWDAFFATMPATRPVAEMLEERYGTRNAAAVGIGRIENDFPWFHATHGVNLAMGIKNPLVHLLDRPNPGVLDNLLAGIAALDASHGTPWGTWHADEHLAGGDPQQGVELCQVVELMYSLEVAGRVTGHSSWFDRLERVAFNALAPMFLRDYRLHQYFAQTNQFACRRAAGPWYTASQEATIFGVEPHFGCCTANMHQGWPKLLASVAGLAADRVLALAMPLPCEITHGPWQIVVNGDYPFDNEVEIEVASARDNAGLRIRVPAWCNDASVRIDGRAVPVDPRSESGKTGSSRNGWFTTGPLSAGNTRIELRLPAETRIQPVTAGGLAVCRGPLVFALPFRFEERERGSRFSFPDVELLPHGGAPLPADGRLRLHSIERASCASDDDPLSPGAARCTVTAEVSERATGRRRTVELIPVGATRLRIAQFDSPDQGEQ